MTFVAVAGLLGGCAAATAPRELVNARTAYKRASGGVTAQVAPAELHVARLALSEAERSFEDEPDSYRTRDLAYVAERRVQLAEATASITIEQQRQAQAGLDYQATQGREIEQQGREIAQTTEQLDQTRTALTASERSGAVTAQQLTAEQQARSAADQRTAVAMAALAEMAAFREEPRGMIITLSGSVLFASNQSALLPEALVRLGQVADVLLTTRERTLSVEGHTDSQGSDSDNLGLSQRRADAVRNYLLQRGYAADLVQAHGLGEGQPVADNDNAEGRANNRRVEIVIEREPTASSL